MRITEDMQQWVFHHVVSGREMLLCAAIAEDYALQIAADDKDRERHGVEYLQLTAVATLNAL